MGGRSSSANLGKSLEYADHTLSVLGEERAGLLHHLLIVKTTREHRRNNDPEDRPQEVIVLEESIRVVDICCC